MHINRKARIRDAEEDKLDYMAGIVDSEGTVGYHSGSIRLGIKNTDMRLHKWLKKNFGGNYYLEKKQKQQYKQVRKWEANGKDAYKVLKKIEGRLLLKNEQLLLDIELYERITKWEFKKQKPKPLWAKDLTEEINAKLHVLNKTGVDKTGKLRPDDEILIKNKLAYMGGYCDGDGTIGIRKNEGITLAGYAHHISIESTDLRSTNWIEKNWGGTTTPIESKKEGRAKKYQWELYGKDAYKLIKDVRDYLMLKQVQADCVVTLYEKVVKWNFKRRPLWAVKLQESMFQICKELNKTGDDEEEEEFEIEEIKEDIQKGLDKWI